MEGSDSLPHRESNVPLPEGMDSNMIKRYEKLIKGWIFGSVDERLLGNLVQLESASQLWKGLESYTNAQINSTTEVPSPGFMFRAKLVSILELERTEQVKRMMELYEATVEGRWGKAKSILKNHEDVATKAISENSNTMLHLAIQMGHNYFVKQLLMFLGNGTDVEKRNIDGRTALHVAAMVDNKYAAQLLVQKSKQLLWILDNKEQSPLDIAYNNIKLNTYAFLLTLVPSYDISRYPGDSTNNAVKLIVTSIAKKQYDIALMLLQKYPELASKNDQILMIVARTFPYDLDSIESFIYPSLTHVCQRILVRGSLLFHCDVSYKFPMATFYPLYELICLLVLVLRFPVSVLYFLIWKVLGVVVRAIKIIEQKKKMYKEAFLILSLICDQMGRSTSCYNGPILEAVRHDVFEVVDEILYCAPDTINCQDEEGHSVIQLAIINRSQNVYYLIHHIIEHMESYRTMKDSSKNNLVHLAGRLAPSYVLNRTNGAAMQLQHELRWFKEVHKLLSPLELEERNIYMETPLMVFKREHADLVKEGECWAKATAESSSIIAALNVTIAFAAAITVPGGSNQDSGIPLFKKEIAFAIFGQSNAISLFTSVSALLLFLSVITTGFSEKVFPISLQRLLLGLYSLFVSTIFMIVAFGAILFLVFCDQRPWMLAPVFVYAFHPISVIFTIKLPLMVALIRSIFFPILGKKSNLSHCKINRKNTIFFG